MAENPRLVEILGQLVSYPTVTGTALAVYDCLQFAEQILQSSGVQIHKHHSGGFESLVATTTNTKRPKLLLQAHIDVVPADKSMFTMRRDNGRLEGRGVFDMKYAAACYLLLAEELKDQLDQYDFGIMFTSDEEGNGQHGVKYLLEQGYGSEICVLPDGGDNWQIETAAKGGWAVRAAAHGKTAHGSRPWEGENAIESLLLFVKQAKKLIPVGGKPGTTMVISQFTGGRTHNQVPDDASVTLDIRYTDSTAGTVVRKHLEALAAKMRIQLETITDIEPIALDPTLPLVHEWERVVGTVRKNYKPGYTFSYGASDARYLAGKGIPSIVTRPDGGGHHSSSEWIDEAGLYDFYECIKRYVQSVAATGVATEAEKQYTETKLPETVTD
jgi:succinyl-diaminopimelate desuccinylase